MTTRPLRETGSEDCTWSDRYARMAPHDRRAARRTQSLRRMNDVVDLDQLSPMAVAGQSLAGNRLAAKPRQPLSRHELRLATGEPAAGRRSAQ
jgi:hypothetical protein